MFLTKRYLLHTVSQQFLVLALLAMSLMIASCSSCSQGPGSNGSDGPIVKDSTSQQIEKIDFKIIKPIYGSIVKLNSSHEVLIEIGEGQSVDSIVGRLGNQRITFSNLSKASVEIARMSCGNQNLVLTAYHKGQSSSQKCLLIVQPDQAAVELDYKVIRTYPHNTDFYTQGFEYHDGTILESTGQNGRSQVLFYRLGEKTVEKYRNLDYKYFGEGSTMFKDKVYQLTWQSRTGFIYDSESMELIRKFNYPNEGWGICHDEKGLIMSNGTQVLSFLDPESLFETKRIEVYDENGPVQKLNELEFVNGLIYANIYLTDKVVAIDPITGAVVNSINLEGLLNRSSLKKPADVLNGIAYNEKSGNFLFTGKLWPNIFEVKLGAGASL